MARGKPGIPAATCHPDRPHYGRGFCKKCAGRDYYARNKDAVRKRTKSYQERNVDRRRVWARTWREKNRNQTSAKNKAGRTRTYRLRKYGLTPGDYLRMAEAQQGRCGICGRSDMKLVVDHDHASGVVRGLLCSNCNCGLGSFGDSRALLLSAHGYLGRMA